MTQHYSNQERANDPNALPDIETFYARIVTIDCAGCGETYAPHDGDWAEGKPINCPACLQPTEDAWFAKVAKVGSGNDLDIPVYTERPQKGWYWQSCSPGCLPDSEPIGPFDTEEEALADAQQDAIDEQTEQDCVDCDGPCKGHDVQASLRQVIPGEE